MIHFLYGEAGAGKSTFAADSILKDLKEGRRALLLVPEQETVAAEARISVLTEKENIPTDRLEVLSFRRLANRIFREYGLLSYHYVGKGAKALIMWMTLDEQNPSLKEYRSARDGIRRMVPLMLKAVDDFRTYRITPKQLDEAAQKAEMSDPRFASRLRDLALVYGAYEKKLKEGCDDPKDDLDNLVLLLDEHRDALHGLTVYIDSFHGFTEQEYAVIRRIFRDAENVTVTFGFLPSSKSLACDGIKKTASDLKRFAADAGKTVKETSLSGSKRFAGADLAFLSENLWSFDKTGTYPEEPASVTLMAASDRYAESEAIAQKIAALVRKGVRYREIAVTVRDTGSYEGILDAYLEKYGIPYFLSVREPLTAKPLIRLILSALAIRADSWRADDVIGYLKTGLTDIPTEDIDLFETYVNRWSIRGRRFWDEHDWTMNPDGYDSTLSEKAAGELDRINAIRRRIADPLHAFFECFEAESTVYSVSAALYRFLTGLKLPGENASDEDVRVFNAVCDALDQLVAVMPLTKVTADLYRKLFLMLTADADIGNIPKGSDCVTVGSSATVRNDGIRYVFLMGVNEGIFPAAIPEDSLFTDSEKLYLENECGLSMPPRTSRLESEELYGFLRAASCASDGVIFSYPVSDPAGNALKPSLAVYRLKALFPKLNEETEEKRPVSARVFSAESSFESAIRFRHTSEGRALNALYRETEGYAERAEALKMPISDPEASVSESTVRRFYGDEIYLSQSRMDKFLGCPFSFWGQYPLGLREKNVYSFDAADTGTLVHHILENYLREVREKFGSFTALNREEADAILTRITDDYFTAVFGSAADGKTPDSCRFLFDRVRRSTRRMLDNLTEEFSVSRFEPSFFELRIGKPTGADALAVPPPDLRTESGLPIRITGSVDRTDLYTDGKDVYVRVVDYKTGKKSFKKERLPEGKFIQMPLYLFCICDSSDESLKKAFGVPENGSLKPAGILYYNAKLTKTKNEKKFSEVPPEEAAKDVFRYNGLLTNDLDVLEAMEPGLGGKFIPAKKTMSGSLDKRSQTVEDAAEFDGIRDTVHTVIRSTAESIVSGRADIDPKYEKDANDNPCRYCGLKPVCRKVSKATGEDEEENGDE
ncbi:MAG: PD-(D/E)XK nuclease family protein [Lachnospiraceae bacterium]|nr:PD-(D/E)XK nuclease family protein [Lachnospiraceae bacterium]